MISAKHPPFSRRKITFKSLLCAALLAVIFVVASCGGVEPDDDSYAPPVEIPDSGDNAGNTGDGGNQGSNEDNTGNGGNQGEQGEQGNQGNQGDQGNQGGQGNENQDPDPDTPEKPEIATTQSILKDILGEDTYNSLSGKLSSNITLTAQTIVDVTDIFPVLEEAVNNSTKKDEVKKTLSAKGEDVKVALVAEVEKKLTISKESIEREGKPYIINESGIIYSGSTFLNSNDYTISTTLTKVLLSGKFDIDNIYIKSLSGPIEFNSDFKLVSETYILEKNKAMFISELKNMYDNLKLSSKTVDKLPMLDLAVYVYDCEELKHFMEIYDKYNSSEKMQITGNFSDVEFDGSKLVSNSSGYTLFSNNTAKTSNDSSIKSITADELVKLSNKYGIHKIKNIIVSGNSSVNSVNWTDLTNVIFEGDMSQLTINNKTNLNGIVYFKDLPYEDNLSYAEGSLKLDKMSGTMDVTGFGNGEKSFVLDISNISDINNYTGNVLIKGSSVANAVYFNENQKSNKGRSLYSKIADEQSGVIENVYFGKNLEENEKFNKSDVKVKTSPTARTLEEFEYFGNNGTYPDGGTVA